MTNYIGITLGPIEDTMELTSTPAGVWAASYLFSFLAHEIRYNIGKSELLQDELPYDPNDNKKVSHIYEKGVGLYHDRIIFEESDKYSLDVTVNAVKQAVDEIVKGFSASEIAKEDKLKEFFYSYFNIHILRVPVKDGESFLIKVNDALDATELEKVFPSSIQTNPILSLFDGDEEKKNELIKKSFLVSGGSEQKIRNWILTNDSERGIKDLPTIAKAINSNKESPYGEKDKAKYYYAVVQADGDSMGDTVKAIQDEKNYKEFSEQCIRYGCKTAEIVLKYGGIPIYVGGDDLLCIVPLMYKIDGDNRTFLDMVKEIRKEFKNEFQNEPDLSFGIQIQYIKAPLHEALKQSASLLFDNAKSNKPGAMAINLRKHSGQSAQVLLKRIGDEEQGSIVLDNLNDLIKKHVDEETLKSVGKHIADFAELFNQAGQRGAIDQFFDNVFDNGVSDNDKRYIDNISDFTKELIKQIQLKTEKDKDDEAKTKDKKLSDELSGYIRLIKFFSEKVDREEANG